jgi:bifunctional NMN adenylyltransferase/nudix hydrolase
MLKYKFAVVIGRFQPFHNGHLHMLEKAFQQGEKVIVILGSAHSARNIKNPWTAEEREQMIRASLPEDKQNRILFAGVRDYYYNENMWVADIQGKVRLFMDEGASACLVGHRKDNSSYYLSLFPKWHYEEVASHKVEGIGELNATELRKLIFNDGLVNHIVEKTYGDGNEDVDLTRYMPEAVIRWLLAFRARGYTDPNTPVENEYDQLRKEYGFIEKYKKDWASAPYAPYFITTDMVVIKSGHVLVVRRKTYPGKGLLALPGGFLGQTESIIDGAFRELKEETGIRVPMKELRASVKNYSVFDYPTRSLRGRTVSHAYLVDLGSGELPNVKGGDDADKAFWMPIYDVLTKEDQFYEDHAHIITSFIHK